jgi:hypothetical protein
VPTIRRLAADYRSQKPAIKAVFVDRKIRSAIACVTIGTLCASGGVTAQSREGIGSPSPLSR